MKRLKFFVFCPNDDTLIQAIINAASKHGAGIYGNYSHNAFITRGNGQWKSEIGSHPYEGTVGELTQTTVAKVEMMCPKNKAKVIDSEIKKIHPWEQVDIDYIELVEP